MILLIMINQNTLLIVGVSVFIQNKQFMTDWYHLYLEQQMGIFRPNMEPWDKLYYFDQTTLWWLLKKEKKRYKGRNI